MLTVFHTGSILRVISHSLKKRKQTTITGCKLVNKMHVMNQNIILLMHQPALVIGGGQRNNDQAVDDSEEKDQRRAAAHGQNHLVKCPKTLSMLWNKWGFGIGNNKPAKEFTPGECQQKENKHKYCATTFGMYVIAV